MFLCLISGGCGSCGPSAFGTSASSNSGATTNDFLNGGSASSFVSAGNQNYQGSGDPNVAFWWAGSDSPFKKAQEYYKRCAQQGNCGNIPGPVKIPGFEQAASPCGTLGCVSQSIQTHKPIDFANNPFFNGEYKGISVSACSGAGCPGGKPGVTITNCKGSECKTVKQEGEPSKIDFSANPFLSSVSGGSSFRGSHGAGSDIAKHHGFGSSSSGSSYEPKPTAQPQSGHTPSYQGTTSFGTSAGSSHTSFGHGQTYPTAQTHTTSFGTNTGSFGHSGIGQSGPGCSGKNCQPGFGVPSKDITPPPYNGNTNKPSDADYRPALPCFPGQPGCQQSKPQSIPQCYPGQPGCATVHQEQKPEPIPSCYPGQPGCSGGTQSHPTSQPAFTSGFSHSGSSGFSASGAGSTSYSSGPTAHSNYPGSQQGQHSPKPEGQLTLKCSATGYICVEKHLCNNGVVHTNGEDIFQSRDGVSYFYLFNILKIFYPY